MVRISGLASGMDIDTMVSDLMKAERVPLNKLTQKKQLLEWKRDDYRSMNTLLLNFRSDLTGMKLSTNYRARQTTSSDETKLTATATSAASLASYAVSEVTQLASAATRVNTEAISAPTTSKVDVTKKLSEMGSDFKTAITWKDGSAQSQTVTTTAAGTTVQLTLTSGATVDTTAPMNVKVNGVTYEVIDSAGTLDSAKKQVKIDSAGQLTFSSEIASGSTIKADYVTTSTTEKYTSFSIQTYDANGNVQMENFNISGSDTLTTMMNKVNSSNVGVTMYYDSVKDQVTLTRKATGDFKTGDGNEIVVNGSFINDTLKFAGSTETGGKNAKFTINGLQTERPSNTFEISGVTFNLKTTFTDPVNVSVSNNTTAVYDNIKNFVTKYNELIDKVKSEVDEERYKDYTPLSDEEREKLSDKQQEQWEEKAKSGMLRRDSILSGLLTKMRSDFSNPVSNPELSSAFKQLSAIGITTSTNYLEGGKLVINEAKLKSAIESDPTAVEKLFTATGSTTAEKGFVQRLADTVNDGMEKIRAKAGNSYSINSQFELGKSLNILNSKIDSFEDRLAKIENRYWSRFTAMEKAIQRSNEQMSQLSSYFS